MEFLWQNRQSPLEYFIKILPEKVSECHALSVICTASAAQKYFSWKILFDWSVSSVSLNLKRNFAFYVSFPIRVRVNIPKYIYIYKYPSNTFHFIVSANMITYYGTIRSDKSCRCKWHKQSNHLGCANHSSLKIGTLHISTLWRSWNLAWRSRRNANHFCFQKVCFRKCSKWSVGLHCYSAGVPGL